MMRFGSIEGARSDFFDTFTNSRPQWQDGFPESAKVAYIEEPLNLKAMMMEPAKNWKGDDVTDSRCAPLDEGFWPK